MKKLLYTFLFNFCLLATISAQVVINEIMYNPPEGGSDSLEYVELYNSGANAVDITGWSIDDAFDFTFPNMTLGAGAYTLIAVDSVALMTVLGVASRQWTGGALSNSGETITLMDASSNVIDVVTYDDFDPWPTEPDGNGNSLELCDAGSNNDDASNWIASENGTGIMLNGNEIFASPGQANNASCTLPPDHIVDIQGFNFVPADITIAAGETVQWNNTGGTHNVNGNLATYPNNPEGFYSGDPASAPWTFSYTFNIVGFYDYQCDQHIGLGMTGTVTVLDPEIEAVDDEYTIDINTPSNFSVLDNDNLPAGWDTVYINSDPMNGAVMVNDNNGTIDYEADADYCGEDDFEYIVCDDSNCDTATVSITIDCPPSYPQYTIGEVTGVDAEGIADSLDVTCELTGIIYGVNTWEPDGLQYALIDKDDADDGIALFSFSEDFGLSLMEGDEVVVQGIIDQFRGLTEIVPDTLWVVSSNNTLHDPQVVTSLSEDTEAKLIKFENMSFVDIAQWETGSGFGFNVDITNGVDTFIMRIDNDVDLFNMAAPTYTTFNVTGIGWQHDFNPPYDEWYQILPRYMEDLEEVVGFGDPEIRNSIEFYPNPVINTLQVDSEIKIDVIQISNILGQKMMEIVEPKNILELNVSHLHSGVYVITFISDNEIWSSEFVKQ